MIVLAHSKRRVLKLLLAESFRHAIDNVFRIESKINFHVCVAQEELFLGR